jgi:quercetin dioxygenase-like cupin family protein
MPDRVRTHVLLRSEESGGEVSVIENTMPAGAEGPPLHMHDFDEMFYLLDGELVFQVEDELITRRRGEIAFAPRGIRHTLANMSDSDARYLLVCTPAGFERYFAKMAAGQAGVEPPDWALQPTPPVTRAGPTINARLAGEAQAR